MSYASFIAYVVGHVQQRIDASQSGEAATQTAVFWERLLAILGSTEGNITEGIERLRAIDEPAWLALSSGLALFAAQNASGPPAGAGSEGDAARARWWRSFAFNARSALDSILELAGDWLSDAAKRALALLKLLLDLLA